jgi:hypothetical protein
MRTARRHVVWAASMWLFSQLGVLAAVPVLFAVGLTSKAEGALCTCSALGPGHFCPMHGSQEHHESMAESPSADETPDCALRSGTPASALNLSSLLGGVGLVPEAHVSFVAAVSAESPGASSDVPLSRPAYPDLPPPRPRALTCIS